MVAKFSSHTQLSPPLLLRKGAIGLHMVDASYQGCSACPLPQTLQIPNLNFKGGPGDKASDKINACMILDITNIDDMSSTVYISTTHDT